jgi:putative ABC transport system permease protein
MIKFLIKGVIRDQHKSLFPVIVVSLGVFMTVLAHCWVTGILGDMIDFNARFTTGHVKIMSKAYAERAEQVPNDLALTGVNNLISELEKNYPDMEWVQRIRFGGLLDAPDENGETKEQGPFIGIAINILSENSKETERFNILESIVRGGLPQKPGEILISDEFATKLEVGPGDQVTVLTSTMYGSMAWYN